ncbi:MAG: TetR/AcrR family transcriptional regulator [Actinobacteria bacterium]|nr:TetR/AcrR family transcriptional regulator [Actinomycetota bacterium]
MSSRGGDTKRAFLEAAMTQLSAYNFNQIAAPLTVDKLCKAVGLTHGAFYFHWSSKAAFDAELLRFVMSVSNEPTNAADLDEQWNPPEAHRPLDGWVATLREMILANWDFTIHDPRLAPQMLVAVLNDPEAREPQGELYEGVVATYGPLFRDWATQLNLEPRPPYTWRKIAIVASAITEGFSVLNASDFDPQADENGPFPVAPQGHPTERIMTQPEAVRQLYADVLVSVLGPFLRPIEERRDGDQGQTDHDPHAEFLGRLWQRALAQLPDPTSSEDAPGE